MVDRNNQGNRTEWNESIPSDNTPLPYPPRKIAEDIAVNVLRALNFYERAPDRWAVSNIIAHTWKAGGSGWLWKAFQLKPAQWDEVVAYKKLVVLHIIMKYGHPLVK